MKNIKNIVIVILLLIIGCLTGYILINNKPNDNSIQKNENLNEDSKNPVVDDFIKRDDHVYDCTFTRTYRMIDKVDYPLAPDGVSFIVVDDYQGYRPFIVVIPSTVGELERFKYYEFTYILKGKGNKIDDFSELNMYLTASLANKYLGHYRESLDIDLNVEETSKIGFNQINEAICE